MTGHGPNSKAASWLSLLGVCMGIGFLIGITGSVIAAPHYALPVEHEVKLVYAAGLQPQKAAGTQTGEVGTGQINNITGGEFFPKKGCTQCHEVSYYGVAGGVTGPDLTIAYKDVPGRFGKTLEEFLRKPEGTMAEMFARMDITAEEKAKILDLLTVAGGGAAEKADEAEQSEASSSKEI